MGFLRIGSLNARVKKTTEAFSNFMGVSNKQARYQGSGQSANMMDSGPVVVVTRNSAPPQRSNQYLENLKSWGSADNIPSVKTKVLSYISKILTIILFRFFQDSSAMPPPKFGVKKRRGKRDIEIIGLNLPHSTPTTPHSTRSPIGVLNEMPDGESLHDSDSDGACGFDSNWSKFSLTAATSNEPQTPGVKPSFI